MTSQRGGVLITGGAGLLGVNWAVSVRDRVPVTLALHERRVSIARVNTRSVNLEAVEDICRALEEIRPSLVVHAAGMTNVDDCELKPDEARHVNVDLTANVARACAAAGVSLAHISTDHLFGSDKERVSEDEPVSPVNVYGRTKAEAETAVLDAHPAAVVVRTNFYGWGPSYRRSFSDNIIDALRAGRTIRLYNDVFYSPILIESLVNCVHDLAGCGAQGIYHVAGDDRLSKHAFGLRVAERFGLSSHLVLPASLDNRQGKAVRPHHMALSNQKVRDTLGRAVGGVHDHLEMLARQERDGLAAELGRL